MLPDDTHFLLKAKRISITLLSTFTFASFTGEKLVKPCDARIHQKARMASDGLPFAALNRLSAMSAITSLNALRINTARTLASLNINALSDSTLRPEEVRYKKDEDCLMGKIRIPIKPLALSGTIITYMAP